MRISSVALVCALASCGEPRTDTEASTRAETDRETAADTRILCALAGAATFTPACTLDRTRDRRGLILTARRPDGGFRRFVATPDGRSVASADGAEPAVVSIGDTGEIEARIGGDRYRFSARAIETARATP